MFWAGQKTLIFDSIVFRDEVRRGYTDLAMKLFGAYAPTKVDLDIQKKEAVIVITPEMIERLEIYERMKAEMNAGKLGHEDLLVK